MMELPDQNQKEEWKPDESDTMIVTLVSSYYLLSWKVLFIKNSTLLRHLMNQHRKRIYRKFVAQ